MSGSMRVAQTNIVHVNVDAIVSATNEDLMPSGRVDRAIHEAAGSDLAAACRRIGYCETGKAVLTNGYRLPAHWVVHTVGPQWVGGAFGEDQILARCYVSCLRLAVENDVHSIAFPAISTGARGFPSGVAARVAVSAVRSFLQTSSHYVDVLFAVVDRPSISAYARALPRGYESY